MTNYNAALLASCSALAIVLGVLVVKELDYRVRRRFVLRRGKRRGGWIRG